MTNAAMEPLGDPSLEPRDDPDIVPDPVAPGVEPDADSTPPQPTKS